LKDSTKTTYKRRIERLCVLFGHRSLESLTRERIVKALMTPLANKPGSAVPLLKLLRVLVRFAQSLDDDNPLALRTDPTAGIKTPKLDEIRAWTDDELAAFEKTWAIGTKQRLAYSLLLYVGAARVDVHLMTWRQLENRTAEYRRSKTGVPVIVDIHTELEKVLAATPKTNVVVITTEYGQPFTLSGFSGFMKKAIRKAGLPAECRPHGLRKTLGRRLADAEATAHQIQAVLGHKTLAEAEQYTREADRRRGGRAAIAKLEAAREHQTNEYAQPAQSGLGKSNKT
jgi:enterobacteria phage integrase